MQKSIQKLERLLAEAAAYFQTNKEIDLTYKTSVSSWSKKEILGHLIDSGINNLQRFTEIQFSEKPFPIRRYNQNELVVVNQYNNVPTDELLSLWLAINGQVKRMIAAQQEETLAYEIIFADGERSDLRFLMVDYVEHMEHHLKKVMGGVR